MFNQSFSYKNLDKSPITLKQTLLIDFIAITAVFAILYSIVSYLIGFLPGVIAMISCFIGFCITLWLYIKHSITYHTAANLYIGNACFIAVSNSSFFSGGDLSPVLAWYILIPVISLLLLGKCRITFIWLTISLVAIVGAFTAGLLGYTFPVDYDYSLDKYFSLICVFGLAGIVFIVTMVFEMEKEKAFFLIKEKNKEIMDSINYAKRLQDAILPSTEIIKSIFKNSFIYYAPKDIVAGDFYWMEKLDETYYFAVADCTGHGVPGAMVSIVCSSSLTKAVVEDKISSPAKILDRSRDLITARYSKFNEDVKDGMDISLISYNPKNREMICAGAYNPIWIIRASNRVIEEIKVDKQPVAIYLDTKPFTETKVKLEKGDRVYLFTDGYVDQFGGRKGKKFLKSKFRTFLLSYNETSIAEQESEIHETLINWMGDHEQVDDICIFGFEAD